MWFPWVHDLCLHHPPSCPSSFSNSSQFCGKKDRLSGLPVGFVISESVLAAWCQYSSQAGEVELQSPFLQLQQLFGSCSSLGSCSNN